MQSHMQMFAFKGQSPQQKPKPTPEYCLTWMPGMRIEGSIRTLFWNSHTSRACRFCSSRLLIPSLTSSACLLGSGRQLLPTINIPLCMIYFCCGTRGTRVPGYQADETLYDRGTNLPVKAA
eukprot:2370601-Rhodomonas_salina.7